MKKLLFIFALFSCLTLKGQHNNSFALLYVKGEPYAPKLLPLPEPSSLTNYMDNKDLSGSVLNKQIRVYENGLLLNSYSNIEIDSTSWKEIKKSLIEVYTTNFGWIHLPLNVAKKFSDSLMNQENYFYTNTDINTPFPYALNVSGHYINYPDTAGMSFTEKQNISNELKNKLIKSVDSVFSKVEAEIDVFCGIPFKPSIHFYLKDKNFDLRKLESLNIKPVHKPIVLWRKIRFIILEQ